MSPLEVLGLRPGATEGQIKAAYRRLAKIHHPDRGGSEAKFIEVTAAYKFAMAGEGEPRAARAHSFTMSTGARYTFNDMTITEADRRKFEDLMGFYGSAFMSTGRTTETLVNDIFRKMREDGGL